MSDIPEDLMKRARELVNAVCLQGMSPEDCHVEAIARALMEERAYRDALRKIKQLKPEPIGDTGFQTGPQALLDAAKRIAAAAIREKP